MCRARISRRHPQVSVLHVFIVSSCLVHVDLRVLPSVVVNQTARCAVCSSEMLLYGTNCVRSASSYQTVAELSEARSQFFFWQHLESADHPLRVAMRRNVMVYVFVFVSALCLHQAAALEGKYFLGLYFFIIIIIFYIR